MRQDIRDIGDEARRHAEDKYDQHPERKPLEDRFAPWVTELMDESVENWRMLGTDRLTAAATTVGAAALIKLLKLQDPNSNSLFLSEEEMKKQDMT